MPSLHFQENKAFYRQLDAAVRSGKPVEIVFSGSKLTMESKLWRRLKKCQNWRSIQTDLTRISHGRPSSLTPLLSPGAVAGFAVGEILVIAFIASLIAGVFVYAIYKERRIRLEVGINPPRLVFEVP